jgi:hypothetical protein
LNQQTPYDLCDEDGDPVIVNDRTLEAARLIARLYDFGVGCHLHVVLDDDNVEDPHLNGCKEDVLAVIAGNRSHPGFDGYSDAVLDIVFGYPPEVLAIEVWIILIFETMTEDERTSASELGRAANRMGAAGDEWLRCCVSQEYWISSI